MNIDNIQSIGSGGNINKILTLLKKTKGKSVTIKEIKNVIKIRQINSDLHHQVFEKLRQEKIVIAFPQRDVHFFDESKILQNATKSIDETINVEANEPIEEDDETKKLLEEIESRNSD